MAETDNSRNEVEIDLDKYMAMIEKLDEQEDKIKEMQEEAKRARDQLAPPKHKFMDLFLDDNILNEKSIIGFISFRLIHPLCIFPYLPFICIILTLDPKDNSEIFCFLLGCL